MAHGCEACIITCEDFRLHQRSDGPNVTAEYVRSLGVDCDLITRAGCIQDLVRPKLGHDDAILRDLTIAVQLHGVKAIHVINHEDCGAYADFDFANRDEEVAQHMADLRAARQILSVRFPEAEVVLAFAELAPGSRDRFVIRRVS